MRKDMEECIEKYNVMTFGYKKQFTAVDSLLSEDETVLYIETTIAVTHGHTNEKNGFVPSFAASSINKEKGIPGVLAITTKRIIFYYKMLFLNSTEVIPLSEIKTFSCKRDLFNSLEIETTGKYYIYNVICSTDILQNIMSNAIENNRKALNNDGKQASDTDYIGQIERLFALKEKGIITEEEFNEKRKELLK